MNDDSDIAQSIDRMAAALKQGFRALQDRNSTLLRENRQLRTQLHNVAALRCANPCCQLHQLDGELVPDAGKGR